MRVTLHTGQVYAVRRGTPVAFEKVEKRWYAVFSLPRNESKHPIRIPVKHIAAIGSFHKLKKGGESCAKEL